MTFKPDPNRDPANLFSVGRTRTSEEITAEREKLIASFGPINGFVVKRRPLQSSEVSTVTTTPVKHTITIHDNRSVLRWTGRAVSFSALVFAPIVVGVIVDSPAMQWAGFVMSGLVLLALAQANDKGNHTVHSIAEARAILDKLEEDA